jgi:transcriptional regulator with XRE-family HTH domain
MSVNKKIKEYIKEIGVSQFELAKKTGISQPNLNRLLTADDIKISQLVELTKALGLPVTYFFDGKEHVSNDEIDGYKKRIEELQYLVNLNKRAELEKYTQVVKEILKYEITNESQEVKNKVLGNYIDIIEAFDEGFNTLALEVSQYSRDMIKKGIEERIVEIKREQTLKPRALNIANIRKEKTKKP